MVYKSKNENDTYKIANRFAKQLNGGDIILLNGDLGAGKTTFVKGLGKALNIKENITSPTFTLLKTYQTEKFNLVHIDAYRLKGDSFDDIYDYLNEENVLLIEWSECLSNQEIFNEYLKININYVSKNQRLFIIDAFGKRYEKMLQEASKDE